MRIIVLFIQRQFTGIKHGGPEVFLKKLYKACLLLIAIPVILTVRILRLLIDIRFVYLDSTRIGHFITAPEIYLCEQEAGIYGNKRSFNIFYYSSKVCNNQLRKMWSRKLRVSSLYDLTAAIDRLDHFLPGYREVMRDKNSCRDIYGVLASRPPHIYFTQEEERLGKSILGKMGIPEDRSFVCFHARDSAYLEKTIPAFDWRYHSYRDSTIHDYIPAVKELVKRGYFALRMGAIVKEPLRTDDSMIIDYASNKRDDFLDIYLGAKCRFFIACGSGIESVSMVFRRPLVYVNFIPLEYIPTWDPVYLFIPKKLWLRGEKRFLPFSAILNSGIGRFCLTEQYEKAGIEVIENTPEEITEVVLEMDDRLNGSFKASAEDEELQQRFWALFKHSDLHNKIFCRIGTEFLRENRQLLN